MTNTKIIYPDSPNIHCWQRVAMLIDYYGQRLRKPLVIFPIISLALSLLLLVPTQKSAVINTLFLLVFTVLPVWYCLSPLAFTIGGDTRPIERLLPPRAGEKFAVQMVFLLLVFPVLFYLFPILAIVLRSCVMHLPETEITQMITMRYAPPSLKMLNGITDNLCSIALVYLVVCAANRHRALYGVISLICYQIFWGIFGAVYAAVWSFKQGFMDGYNGVERANITPQEIADTFTSTPMVVVLSSVLLAAAVLLFYCAYRQIAKKQL